VWRAATSDGAGGVYVGGQTDGSIGGVSTDVLLGHYSGSGELTWLSELGTLRYEAVFSLAFNGLDGMFVCGETDGALGGPYHGINGWTDAWVANYGGPCSWPTIYCAAKVNSIGCTPTISTQGIPSSSAAGGFTIRAESARNQKTGLLLYGLNGPAANPFQGGTLCVAAPVRRTTSVSSGGSPLPVADCSGVYEIDFNAFSAGALGGNPQAALRTPGTQVHAQWWGRDPGFPPPNNTTLSNAVHLSMCL
jgi:hypothetical protein